MNWSVAKLGTDSLPATQSDYLSQELLNCADKGRLILLSHTETKVCVLQNDSNNKDPFELMTD